MKLVTDNDVGALGRGCSKIWHRDSLVVQPEGTTFKIWDVAGGGRELASLSPHHKTVTCLCIADSGGTVVSGSLDRSAIKRINRKNFSG